MQKMGLGMVRRHSRSWAMSPSDRVHMTSYSTFIETMRLSCTDFDIKPVICQKSPISNPTCISRPRWEWPRSNFAEIFGTRKRVTELSCGFVGVIMCLAVLAEHRLVTDTDRQTQGHSIYRAVKMLRFIHQTGHGDVRHCNTSCVKTVNGPLSCDCS